MTNLELYRMLKVHLDNAELMQKSMEHQMNAQNQVVELLDYETSELYSKLTDEEKESLEVF